MENEILIKKLSNSLELLERVLNGGKGSGNFGHTGRPGKVGGSGKGSTFAHPELTDWVRKGRTGGKLTLEEVENSKAVKEAKKRAAFDKDTLAEFEGNAEREKLREKIENKMLSDENGSFTGKDRGKEQFNGKVEQGKEAYIIIGPPAAGKSSVFANPISAEKHARIVDSDAIKQELPEFDNGFGAGRVQEESAMMADRVLQKATDRGDNVVIPRVGGKSTVDLAKSLKDKGYKVHIRFNEVTPESSMTRAMSRFAETGRYLDPSYLMSIGDKAKKAFIECAKNKKLFSSAEWLNNDVPYGSKPKKIWKTGDSEDKLK